MSLKLDQPPDVIRARTALYKKVMDLLAAQTYDAAREANRLHLEWLSEHPDDYIALEAGEVVSKTISAYEDDLLEPRSLLSGSASVALS